MRIVNLTPHPITVAGLTIAPDGRVPRLREETREVGQLTVDGHTVPVTETTLGALEGLPEPADGVVYVVSRLVAEAAPNRHDLYFPGRLVRDSEGRVVGAESLARLPRSGETIVVSTRTEGDIESVRVTVAPAVADALRSLGERGLSIQVETPAERAALAVRWRERLAEMPADAPAWERRELERLVARDQALSGA